MNSMKLKGTKTESDYLVELENSHEFIFNSDAGARLKGILISECSDLRTAYILDSIPEQAEDIYLVLVNNQDLLSVEIDRIEVSAPAIIKREDFREYQKHLSKTNQIRLAVAMKLGANDLNKT